MKKTKDIFDKYEMTEERFWELVGYAKWPDSGYDRPKLAYLISVKKKDGKALRNIVDELWNVLDTFIDGRFDGLNCGDDGYSDLLFHIIGLGKKQFYSHLGSYTKIKDRANEGHMSDEGYKESFVYAIPYCEDWNDIPASIKIAEETIKAREKIQTKTNENDFDTIHIEDAIEDISEYLCDADDKWVAEIYNQVCEDNIECVEDGVWRKV